MPAISNTDDYEKRFLEKYFRLRAKRKIEELQHKIDESTDSFKVLQLKREIKSVEEELEADLRSVQEQDTAEEKIYSGLKTEQIGEDASGEVFKFQGVAIPLNIWNYLFEHQREGVRWMINLYNEGKGGVLADEMGLGKTLQVATFILGLGHSKEQSRFLILSPATMVDHWSHQLKRLSATLKISHSISAAEVRGCEVSILSYELFRIREHEAYFDCVFLDEGHKIKNKDTHIAQTVKRIRSRSRFVITGTPIQNSLSELWSIFDFINPNMLGSHNTFQEEFESRIKKCSTERERQISYQYSVMLRSIIEPFIMRRMKHQVDHMLPGKVDKVIFVKLSREQSSMYIEALESRRFQNLRRMGFRSRGNVLGAIDYLRKICNHPLLVANISFDKYKIQSSEGLDRIDALCRSGIDIIDASSKMATTFDLLNKWFNEKRKVLIFFQTVQMLKIVEHALLLRKSEYSFVVMTGSTPVRKRHHMIESFNSDPKCFIFLLTTRVGGLGLNLTGANRVIIFDPDWNPSTDNQAKERIYRYGQASDVEIYRLICKGTLEEAIYQKQIYKDCLSKKILNNPDTTFTREYFSDLFSFYTSIDNDSRTENRNEVTAQNDSLATVREEDKKDFRFLKKLNLKSMLSGRELIEFIERRELNLDE